MEEAMWKEFEAWFHDYYMRNGFITSQSEAETIWQAAAAAEREQCAKTCDEVAERYRSQEQYAADPGTESYGAADCAAAIRNRKEPA